MPGVPSRLVETVVYSVSTVDVSSRLVETVVHSVSTVDVSSRLVETVVGVYSRLVPYSLPVVSSSRPAAELTAAGISARDTGPCTPKPNTCTPGAAIPATPP